MKARFSRLSRRISPQSSSTRGASAASTCPPFTSRSTETKDMPRFYHQAATAPGDGPGGGDRARRVFGCGSATLLGFPPAMERVFDPDIWRDVTGGEVAERVRRLTRVTPLVPAPALGRRTGADVWLKLENLQRTGSFKLRGAAARIAALALRAGAD